MFLKFLHSIPVPFFIIPVFALVFVTCVLFPTKIAQFQCNKLFVICNPTPKLDINPS